MLLLTQFACHASVDLTIGLDRSNLDTADAFASLNTDLDEALIAPGGTPRVLDKEVLESLLSTIAYYESCMVNIMTTAFVSDNST